MQTIKTFLPIFNGFDYTIFEPDLSEYDYNKIDFDNESYENDIAKSCCEVIQDNCNFISKVTFENVYRDAINCTIKIDSVKFGRWLIANKDTLQLYLKERYTSYDGFFSHYSNDVNDWQVDTNNFKDFSCNSHYLSSLLDFYFEVQDIIEYDLHEYCDIYVDNYVTILTTNFVDLSEEQQIEVLNSGIVDFEFGYNAILKNEAVERANMFGTSWQSELINSGFVVEGEFDDNLKLV